MTGHIQWHKSVWSTQCRSRYCPILAAQKNGSAPMPAECGRNGGAITTNQAELTTVRLTVNAP